MATVCNEAICASIVSKCTLLRSCECTLEAEGQNCSCCKKCYSCLEHLATECCSCVGLCPKSNTETNSTAFIAKSSVGDISEPTPQLWDALMEGDDPTDLWDKLTFQVDDYKKKAPKNHVQDTLIQEEYVTFNCTVAFLKNEIGDRKCEKSCMSMGASSYRWFNNGCCQCVGHGCIQYGVNEARCSFVHGTLIEDSLLQPPIEEDEDEMSYFDLSDEELKKLEDEYGINDDDED